MSTKRPSDEIDSIVHEKMPTELRILGKRLTIAVWTILAMIFGTAGYITYGLSLSAIETQAGIFAIASFWLFLGTNLFVIYGWSRTSRGRCYRLMELVGQEPDTTLQELKEVYVDE
jgi:hypothetical protein